VSSHARASIDDSLSPSAIEAPRESAVSVALAGDDAQAALSPAAALQRRLVAEFDASPAIVGRWSPRRTAVLVIGFNGVFWAVAVALLMRA
jgi:hypothetical protein